MKAPPPPVLCVASGMAAGLCLLVPAIGPAAFVCLAPGLAALLRHEGAGRTLALCFALCLGMLMTAYSLAFSIHPKVADHLVLPIDAAVYAAACLLHGALFASCLWCGLRVPCPRPLRWLAIALFWALAEWLCGAGPLAWPVMQLGLALRDFPVLVQGASWGGLLLVSALVVAANALLAEALRLRASRRALWPLSGAALLMLANGALGAAQLGETATADPGSQASIAVVQPGLSSTRDEKPAICAAALELAQEAALEHPDIIFLPENVIPVYANGGKEEGLAPWAALAEEAGADVLVGGTEDGRATLYHFAPDGSLAGDYRKQREVPFFENGARGKPFRWGSDGGEAPLALQGGRAGAMICYESMLPDVARQRAAEAELLLVPTNDSWFESDRAKGIHLGHDVFRAVETGRTLVQAGMDGYTAVIDAKGNRTGVLETGKPGILYATVDFTARETPWQAWGNAWMLPGLALVAGGAAQAMLAQRQARKNARMKGELR